MKSISRFRNDHLVLAYRLLAVMLVFTICRVLFWWFNRDIIANSSPFDAFSLYLGGIRFDLSAILYLNILFILLSIFPAPIRYKPWWQKAVFWSYILPNTVGIIANCADMEFYKFTLRRTTSSVFATFANEQNKATLLFRFVLDYAYLVIIAALLIAFLVYVFKKTAPQDNGRRGWRFYGVNLLLMVGIVWVTISGMRGGFGMTTRPITLSNAGEYVKDPSQIAIVLNTPFSIFRTYNKKSFERKAYFDNETTLNDVFPAVKQPNPSHPFRYDNVVIFILESWGKENSGLLNPQLENGKYQGYTPFLDSLIKEGLSFKYSFANGKKSIDGMPSVLASVPSMQTPYVLTHQSDNRINSIASLLKPKGYTSAFFHGAPNGSMGFNAFANIAGFDKYYGMTEYGNDADADGFWGIWDEEFFQYFARTMNDMKPPFVTALFSVSSHHPYKVPERYEGKLREGPLAIFRSVNYTDNALRLFFETASKMPWFQNTLFVFTADHTQSHGWHEEYKNNTGYFSIPIVFYKPDGSLRHYDTQRVVQQIDIMPTILGYLGYDQPYVAFGNDIFSTPPENAFAVNYQNDAYQWFSGNHVLLSTGETVYGVYDFTVDPAMTRNIAAAQPELVARLENRLHGFIQQYNNRMLDNKLVIKQ